jgi:beta-glucosidase
MFNIVPQENGMVMLKTHDNRRVTAQDKPGPVRQHDGPLSAKGELFKMKIEKDGLAAAEEAAAKAQQVIFFAGNDPMINGRECIDRLSLNLPPRQEEMIDRVTKANPQTVLFLLSGYPFTCREAAKKVPAIVWMAHGIAETGHGIADIISGAYSPAGRLPQTWYEDESQLPPDIMEYDIMSAGTTYQYFKGKALWPFGHGLSYSSFAYSGLKIDKAAARKDEIVIVTFRLKNSGSVKAEEVPQMYVSVSESACKRPLKTLKGFTRLVLEADEEKEIRFELPVKELEVWDNYRSNFCVETSYCTVSIGASSSDIRLTGNFEVRGEDLFPRKLTGAVYAQNFDNYSGCYLHEKRGSGIPAVFTKEEKGWIHFASLDFGGFSHFSAITQGGISGRIEIRIDSLDGPLAGTAEVPNTGNISFYPLPDTNPRCRSTWGCAETDIEKISGVHDLYLVLYGKTGIWSFEFK